MRFARLDIYELVTENDYARVARHEDVRVAYTDNVARAGHADRAEQLAMLTTFDDNPMRIDDKGIKIDGTLENGEFGFWVLS
jgi:hypothetical protein